VSIATQVRQVTASVARLEAAWTPTAPIDPLALARASGLDPDPWQSAALQSTHKRLLMLVTRQGGKSSISAVIGVHTAISTPNALVLLVSPSLRQSAELFRKCLGVYRSLDRPVPALAETALRLELENGSRVISLPGQESTLRGFSAVDLLLIDEAARVEDSLYMSLRPMMAVSGGRIIVMSTPWGRRGWFFTAWEDEPEWERYEIPATECPRISPDFLAEERRTLGRWWYEQEYCNRFSDTTDQLFSHEVLQASLSHDIPPLFAAS
jgi:hypothetical protein